MRRYRAASRRGSTTGRRTRSRARPRTWPQSIVPRLPPTHRSPDVGGGLLQARGLREKQLPSPFLVFTNEQEPIMQPKRPLLPELYTLRHNAKAGPRWRPGHLRLSKAARKLLDPPLQLGAAGERLRL